MPAGPSSISSGSLLDLKAIAAEHVDRFEKEGRSAVRGNRNKPLTKVKDPFAKSSPGLVKRLAAEARQDSKRRVFQDEGDGPSEEQRRDIMEMKARKYEAFKRGDFSGMTEKERMESAIDFERKLDEDDDSDGYSEHSSDEDESAQLARRITSGSHRQDDEWREDDHEIIEYEDELGRTRTGTRREAREAESQRRKEERRPETEAQDQSSYAEVMNSKVIHGDQNFFPVYEPDADALRKKWREAEEEARAHHYDSTKEVRVKGAGQYQFSLDETKRSEQMAALASERERTLKARQETNNGFNKAMEDRKRKLDARRDLIQAKRIQVLGKDEVEKLDRERKVELERLEGEKKAREAEDFLKGIEDQLGQ